MRVNVRTFVLSAFFASFFVSTHSQAQKAAGVKSRFKIEDNSDDSDTETTLEIDQGTVLGYGGVRWGARSLGGNKIVNQASVRGAWLFQQNLGLGFEFSSLTGNYHPYKERELAGIVQNATSAGFVAEKFFGPKREFHYSVALGIGRQFLSLEHVSDASLSLPVDYQKGKAVDFISPELNLIWNATKYTRPTLGASLFVPIMSKGNDKIKNDKLFGVFLSVGVNIGNFTY